MAGAVLAIFSFFIITSAVSFFRFRAAHYFGTVTNITNQQLVIADKKVGTREFIITDKTQIRSGKKVQDNLSVGQDVMIVAKQVGTSSLEALEIRVFEPRN